MRPKPRSAPAADAPRSTPRRLAPASLLLLVGTGLAAQVSPRHFASAEAPASTRSPLAIGASASRTLQIHEDVSILGNPIRGIALRRDGARREIFSALSVSLSLSMSTSPALAAAPDPVFDRNHGANRTLVVASRQFNFPQSFPVNTLPAPFAYVILFDAPFAARASSSVVWDLTRNPGSVPPTPPAFDFVSTRGDADPEVEEYLFGAGCVATGRTVPMSPENGSNGFSNWPGGTIRVTMSAANGPANAAAAVILGLSNVAFGGLTLPFELPGSSAAPSGPCSILTDAVLVRPMVLNLIGVGGSVLDLSVNPSMHGATLFQQVLAVDPPANPMGLVTSSALGRQIIAPYAPLGVGRVEGIQSTGTTGFVLPNAGVVVQFIH